MKRFLIIISLLALSIAAFALSMNTTAYASYNAKTGNVTITYNLTDTSQKCHVYILVSDDGGTNYNIVPQTVTGDVGYNVSSGSGKTIVWNAMADNMPYKETYRIKVVASDTDATTPIIGDLYRMGRTDGDGWPYGVKYDHERPIHNVLLNDFVVGIYEITQGDFEMIMGYNPAVVYYDDPSFGVGANYPAHSVSWYEAIVYCNRRSVVEKLTPVYSKNGSTNPDDWGALPTKNSTNAYYEEWDAIAWDTSADGYRLPTEAEWEYAARGAKFYNVEDENGYTRKFSGSNTASTVAWHSGNNSPVGTKPVGQLGINPIDDDYGVYDMSGNVSEWCWDWYDATYYEEGGFVKDGDGNYQHSDLIAPRDNPKGPASGTQRVRRGGHFSDHSSFARVYDRDRQHPMPDKESNGTKHYVGFRVVRNR